MYYAIMCTLGWPAADAFQTIKRARPQAGIRYTGDSDTAIRSLGYD